MEELNYTVSNAIMSEIYDFTNQKWLHGKRYHNNWRAFFAKSKGPKKWVAELIDGGSLTRKVRVKHAFEKKTGCKARSYLTIRLAKLDEHKNHFKFTNKPSKHPCQCPQDTGRNNLLFFVSIA